MRHCRFLLFPVLLAGCAVGPDYHPPAPTASKAFVGQAAIDARTGQLSDLTEWWRGFGDPMLAHYVSTALAQNLDIEQALARVTQSRATLRSANAALLPSATIGSQVTATRQSFETQLGRIIGGIGGIGRNAELYEANLEPSWEIDLFGGASRRREAARADYQGTVAGVAAARLSVAAQTADTYIVIRGLQARLAIARDQAGAQRRLVDLIDLQYRKGVVAELQLRQAQGALSQVEATIPVLQTVLETALNAFDVLLGDQPGTHRAELAVARPVPLPPAITDAGGPADLLRRRPDLIVAERRLAASNAQIGAAIAEYYPKISLRGLLGSATSIAPGNLFGDNANQATGILGLRWRLFDFGRVDAEIAAARGANAEALAAYRLAVLRASEDVENAFSALVQREAQARTLATGDVALERARSSSGAAYRGGVVSLLEVIDADARLLQNRDALAQAKVESARGAIASFQALGGGWATTDR